MSSKLLLKVFKVGNSFKEVSFRVEVEMKISKIVMFEH